jgi:hypothetical protein
VPTPSLDSLTALIPVRDPVTNEYLGGVLRSRLEIDLAYCPDAVIAATPNEVSRLRETPGRPSYEAPPVPIIYSSNFSATTSTTNTLLFTTAANTVPVTPVYFSDNYIVYNNTFTVGGAWQFDDLYRPIYLNGTGAFRPLNADGTGAVVWSEIDPVVDAKAERRKKRAVTRARKLLREHLTDQEHDQLQEAGYFEVTSDSGRRYRIYKGFSRNVVELDATGRPVARLCAHGGYGSAMPDEDHMLAQKLWLESEEQEFRRIANISRIGAVEADHLLGISTRERTAAKYRDILRGAPAVAA